jgi:hypothetical protein
LCAAHSEVPSADKPFGSFVLDQCVRNEDANNRLTCVVMTTHKMLSNRAFRILHIDATYKLAYKEWPVVLIISQSPDHRGRLIAVCVVCAERSCHFQFCLDAVLRGLPREEHPKVIVSDADDAIGLAIEATLPDTTHVMCWFHMGSKAAWAISRCSKAMEALHCDEQVLLAAYSCFFFIT